jgi:hypothetical protein
MVINYTGIGSRNTPNSILQLMIECGRTLAQFDTCLRSGAASGADAAFEHGCDMQHGKKEIYLPWKNFSNHTSQLHNISPEAFDIAQQIYGSRWKYLKHSVKCLMARNMYQVMGESLDSPSDFLLCWTPDGCKSKQSRSINTGGTGQAIAYADMLNIPIYNFFHTTDIDDFFYNIIDALYDPNL